MERAVDGLNQINETIKTDNEHFEQASNRLNALEQQLDSIKNRNIEMDNEIKRLKKNIENQSRK